MFLTQSNYMYVSPFLLFFPPTACFAAPAFPYVGHQLKVKLVQAGGGGGREGEKLLSTADGSLQYAIQYIIGETVAYY